MLHLAARYLLAWKCMSRQNENPAKSAASHLMRGRIVRWLCESCAGSSGDLLTPSPPAENGIAAHPRQRGDRMTWWRSAIADLGSRRWVWDRSRRRGGHNREWIVPCCRQSHRSRRPRGDRSRHRRHPPHSAHADARPHEPTREAAIAGWRQELASSPSFLYGGQAVAADLLANGMGNTDTASARRPRLRSAEIRRIAENAKR